MLAVSDLELAAHHARSAVARVTVEDCVDKVENRFELVLVASHRARLLSSGSQITIDRDNDKNPVVSLREIADETASKKQNAHAHQVRAFDAMARVLPDLAATMRAVSRCTSA